MKDSFYIRLPSNVTNGKSAAFEGNTLSTYTTRLATPQFLSKKYEVGLSEISYTNSWYNLKTDQRLYIVDESLNDISNTQIHIKAGRYETQKELVDMINNRLESFKGRDVVSMPVLKIHVHARRVSLTSGQMKAGNHFSVKFSQELAEILGFEQRYLQDRYRYKTDHAEKQQLNIHVHEQIVKGRQDAHYNYEMTAGINSLLVYSNIVEPSLVGDSYSQLLRIVSIPRKSSFGEQVVLTYEKPQYFRLLTPEFQTIEISIKDDNGEDIPFKFGRTVVTLHFRETGYE